MIVTANLKHFPADVLEPWNVKARHPDDFLITLYSMESGIVVSKLADIASDRGTTPQKFLSQLGKIVPMFAQFVADDLNWDLD